MQLPREVIVGRGTLSRIPEVVKRLGLRGTALIVAGATSYEIAGKKVREYLTEIGIDVDTILVQTATPQDVSIIEERIKEWRPQILFGVGGGTKIDAAKLSSASQNLPFISIPTTLSHDGIASPLASIRGCDQPYSVMAQAPLAIIADTEIIASAPQRSRISGCGDVISKFTAVKDWRLSHIEKDEYYGEYAASLALMSATLVVEKADLIQTEKGEGPRILLEALISCGVAMSIAGSSRPCSGSEHLFSHALEMMKCSKAMHGEQCGVGAIMMSYLYGSNWKRIKDTLKCLGAPTNAQELGITDEDVIKALQLATTIRPERYTILQKLNLDQEACKELAKATEIIK